MVAEPSLPTVCVVSVDFNQTTQTFIRRHARELNGGNTVLVAHQKGDDTTSGKPLLFWPRPVSTGRRGLWQKWFGPAPVRDHGSFPEDFAAFLHQHKVGIVLCEFGTLGVQFAPWCKRAGVPMFCYFRGTDATRALRNRHYRAGLSAMMPQIDGIVCVSAYLRDCLARRGFRHANTHIIPSGVDTPVFAPETKDPGLILAVGRMTAKKGPLTTIRAFAEVAKRHPGIRLEMVGDGELLEPARRLVQRLGVSGRVTLHGARDHTFVAQRMRQAAIFMQHSVTDMRGNGEGAPTAIQEAMTAGAAVVSTRHAGIPELIEEGVTGLLVRERDLSGYTRALEAVVSDVALRQQLGAAAHVHAVESFDYRKLYARLEGAMAATVAGRVTPSPQFR